MYQLLQQELPQTTIISVGHRSTLKTLHQQQLILQDKGNGKCYKKRQNTVIAMLFDTFSALCMFDKVIFYFCQTKLTFILNGKVIMLFKKIRGLFSNDLSIGFRHS